MKRLSIFGIFAFLAVLGFLTPGCGGVGASSGSGASASVFWCSTTSQSSPDNPALNTVMAGKWDDSADAALTTLNGDYLQMVATPDGRHLVIPCYYYEDGGIRVVDRHGALVGWISPGTVVFHAACTNTTVYWQSSSTTIMAANLDGSNVRSFVNSDAVLENGLAANEATGNVLDGSNLYGSDGHLISSSFDVAGNVMASSDTYVYSVSGGTIFRTNWTTGVKSVFADVPGGDFTGIAVLADDSLIAVTNQFPGTSILFFDSDGNQAGSREVTSLGSVALAR